MRVLVIDDEDDIRSMLGLGLACMGFDADVAGNRDEGLKLLLNKQFDAIIVDWFMPGMTMQDFLKHTSSLNSVPLVVLLSASGAVKQFAEEVGLQYYLSKPFDVKDVSLKLRSWSQAT
jgi:DNA-binding response OmpR family regulator